jgi:hypothetical protein
MRSVFRAAVCAIILLSLFSGCKKKMLVAPVPAPQEAVAGASVKSGPLIVRTASMELQVDSVADSVTRILSYIGKQGGLIDRKTVSGDREARLDLRLPSESLESTVEGLAAYGKVKSRKMSATEVTGQAIDLEARLKNAVALRDRLRTLLEKAVKVEDILAIERELARLQGDIDSLEGRLKNLKGKIEYASIDLHLKRKWVLGPLGYTAKGLGWFIRKLFVLN